MSASFQEEEILFPAIGKARKNRPKILIAWKTISMMARIRMQWAKPNIFFTSSVILRLSE